MSRIRPLEPADLAAVADLYDQVVRSITLGPDRAEVRASPKVELVDYFERLSFDQPGGDADLPSLVYEGPGGEVVGFLASYPRRFTWRGRAIRAVCTGQLVVHPEARAGGVGALLMRASLTGAQDLTITDGATGLVREMWERSGGVTPGMTSMVWTRSLRPVEHAAGRWLGGPGTRRRAVARLPLAGADRLAARRYRPASPAGRGEPLTSEGLVEAVEGLGRTFRLRPDYDVTYLTWLLEEMAAVRSRGELVARAVHGRQGGLAGWYVAYAGEGSPVQVVQLAGNDPGLVLDELFQWAAGRGAPAVQGRVDHFLYPALRERGCRLSPGPWALVHSRDTELLADVLSGKALLSRMDGEWWMGHHRRDVQYPPGAH